MAWVSSNVTPQMAIERGWATWDVFLSNWNVTSIVDPNIQLFPNPATQASVPSINGVMIGPYSDIDRVKIRFNANLPVPDTQVIVLYNTLNERLCSVESPITYPLGGPISIVADENTQVPATGNFIADDGAGTATSYGIPNGVGNGALLHLVFFLSNSVIQPLRRYPYNIAGVLSATAGTALKRVLPIMGRKQARVTFNNIGPNAVTVRIGLIGPNDRVNLRAYENTLTSIAVPVNGTESFTFGACIHDTQYLSIWTTCAGGESAALYYNFEWTDVPGGGGGAGSAP
jgi:hypothetical protein